MTTFAVFQELKPVDIPLENIFLDPNNPRFVGVNWDYVSDEEIDKASVQETTLRRLVQYFAIDKLRMNMEVNGYLPIDRVVVREFATDKYVVLEGNRRIAAAKRISTVALDGSTVSQDVVDSLREIPCLQYTGTNSEAAWIFQGLRHITGFSDWSAFNKAKLLVEQMEEEELTLTEVGKRFGLTPHGAGQWVRGYYAFKQAREDSDYINEVDERSYPYFQELFSRSSAAVRDWLEWNEGERKFDNPLNFNEFIGWLYPRSNSDEEGAEDSDAKGDFEQRYLVRTADIRSIAFLVNSAPDAFAQFRGEHNLDRAYSIAQAKKYEEEAKEKADPVAEVFESIKDCTRALDNIPYKVIRDEETRTRLFMALDELEKTISALR